MNVSACILSVSGPVLLPDEGRFLREANPWGVILMGRSCIDREQTRALIADIHQALGRTSLVFIDQEGGRVARLRPPEWPCFPSAATYGRLYAGSPEMAIEACYLGFRLLGHELACLGIRADCAPVADLYGDATDLSIGDRSFGSGVDQVVALSGAALRGLHDSGVQGCLKHMPGLGQATCDSHLQLPRITADRHRLQNDFSVFSALVKQASIGMVCHAVFEAVDRHNPATLSPCVINEIIRGQIGFDGLLITDDLGMNALSGRLRDRVAGALTAGCDIVLHCSGFLNDCTAILAEMEEIVTEAGMLAGQPLERARAVEVLPVAASGFDPVCERQRLDSMLKQLVVEE